MLTDVKKILDQLMDEENWEPIEIVNSKGESARFNQIALIPMTVESQKYVDESVEHNFAILHPLDDAGEEIGKPLVVDITIDEDKNYELIVVDHPELIGEIMAEYREVRGITPDDLAIENPLEDSDEEIGEESAEDGEVGESEDEPAEETPKKKGFFSRLFGKKDD